MVLERVLYLGSSYYTKLHLPLFVPTIFLLHIFRLIEAQDSVAPSPLLVAVAIEPLAIALHQNSKMAGIIRGGQEHKVSLYADDLLLYISDPSKSLLHVLKIVDMFGRLSGYKLNLQKSEMFPINNAARELSAASFPFKVSHSFTYLGIRVPNTFSKLFTENFPRLLERVEQDFKRWACFAPIISCRSNKFY